MTTVKTVDGAEIEFDISKFYDEFYELRFDSRDANAVPYTACKRCGMDVYGLTKHVRNVHGDDAPRIANARNHLSDDAGRYIGGNAHRLAKAEAFLRERGLFDAFEATLGPVYAVG